MNGLKVESRHEPMNASNVLPNSKLNVSADEYFPVFELVYLVDVCLVIIYKDLGMPKQIKQNYRQCIGLPSRIYLYIGLFCM